MSRFIMKHIDNRKPQVKIVSKPTVSSDKIDAPIVKKKNIEAKEENKKKINEQVMTTSEKVAMAQSVLSNEPKRIKKDKGLIERTESSKTILTEDNKELLND